MCNSLLYLPLLKRKVITSACGARILAPYLQYGSLNINDNHNRVMTRQNTYFRKPCSIVVHCLGQSQVLVDKLILIKNAFL